MTIEHSYQTGGGVTVSRSTVPVAYPGNIAALARQLDRQRGVLLSSSFEFPGRYTRWDLGFVDPPLVLTARARGFAVAALNARGEVLLEAIAPMLHGLDAVAGLERHPSRIVGELHPGNADPFPEEERSRQPSVFSVIRGITELFAAEDDPVLGLYGAFGYDLVFQFEPMALQLPRAADQRDLVLYLPDEILLVDHMRQTGSIRRYEFKTVGGSTAGLPRATVPAPYVLQPNGPVVPESDHAPGEFAAAVERAREAFGRGDLFEAVLGQLFAARCPDQPSVVFDRLRRLNPAPYGALMNLGEGEFLVAASPEMFVRVEGRRIETCPISGTVRRGADAIEDSERIRELLNSAKDEAELTMCTDVDRNDKSRVCEPGSVRVIGRRQIEMYSRLIHTVDHVEGVLRPGFDALDGFLTHAWAVTVSGAPKRGAIRFIEAVEKSPRRWYGGAIGGVTFDGNINTGLTLRTIRMAGGVAEVRAGATLLYDSVPAEEEAETRLKASAMFIAIAAGSPAVPAAAAISLPPGGQARRVLLVDHEDSFVHMLAGYFRAVGAEVETLRAGFARARLAEGCGADLAVLSPGPGRPADFAMGETLDLLLRRGLPVFGVCLGLQGIVEHFGGALDVLAQPMHGKSSEIRIHGGRLFEGLFERLPGRLTVGRYHSLHARRATLPATLEVTAETADGVVMAVQHRTLPVEAVQFHPESMMTAAGAGQHIVARALRTEKSSHSCALSEPRGRPVLEI